MSTDAAASTVLTGASGLLIAALGVEPQAIAWALLGSILGLTLAKPAGRLYAVALFISATLVCALLATVLADHWFEGRVGARNVLAVALAAGFHPMLEAFFSAVPGLVAAGSRRARAFIGGSSKP